MLLVTFVGFAVYQLTLVLLPFDAARTGEREVAAGALTASFMAGATIGPLLVPRLCVRPGVRSLLVWATVAEAAATVLVGLVHPLGLLLAANTARGLTFGVIAAALPLAVLHASPLAGRGRALGVWGLVCTIPGVFAPALAVTLSQHGALLATMWVAAGVLLFTAVPIALGRGRRAWPGQLAAGPRAQSRASIRLRRLAGPTAVFLCSTLAYGAVVSFMPLFLTGREHVVATSVGFLVAMGIALPAGRLLGGAGRTVDSGARLLPAGALLAAAGLTTVVVLGSAPLRIAAGAACGLGFGIVATASLVAFLARVGADHPDVGSAAFSAVFNLGIGIGGLGAGLVAQFADLRLAFGLCAAMSIISAPLAVTVARLTDYQIGGSAQRG